MNLRLNQNLFTPACVSCTLSKFLWMGNLHNTMCKSQSNHPGWLLPYCASGKELGCNYLNQAYLLNSTQTRIMVKKQTTTNHQSNTSSLHLLRMLMLLFHYNRLFQVILVFVPFFVLRTACSRAGMDSTSFWWWTWGHWVWGPFYTAFWRRE